MAAIIHGVWVSGSMGLEPVRRSSDSECLYYGSASSCSYFHIYELMVATGARVRLIRRGAARPVGVRWAAPIACARSVQAVAKRQRCL